MSTNVERDVFNVRYTEFPDKNYCTVVLFDALPLKSTRSYTFCTWSCSERTECVRTLTRPRTLRTKVRTGSYWIHPRASWSMEASRRVIPPLTSWWLHHLGRMEACLTLWCNQKHTKCMEYKLLPLTIIKQKINTQCDTKFVPCVNSIYTVESEIYCFPLPTEIESILSHFMFQCFSCVRSLSWQDDMDKGSGAQ